MEIGVHTTLVYYDRVVTEWNRIMWMGHRILTPQDRIGYGSMGHLALECTIGRDRTRAGGRTEGRKGAVMHRSSCFRSSVRPSARAQF